ncbi:hypothetical protein AA0229_0658 [Gluconobacter cerinus NRIC 0229]|uniref:Uncharacterized protein n=1 Tax=Gluconobacter cerinus TaxID=38307 RepID=A0AAV5NCP8_9PROT|nr:hypothetical protein AA0229_0658 [Gluconobacter cerinus NRIC 0229]GLQ61734.1 hypothetical protein GCM10007867_05790 [Gluconobacter cerinus]
MGITLRAKTLIERNMRTDTPSGQGFSAHITEKGRVTMLFQHIKKDSFETSVPECLREIVYERVWGALS